VATCPGITRTPPDLQLPDKNTDLRCSPSRALPISTASTLCCPDTLMWPSSRRRAVASAEGAPATVEVATALLQHFCRVFKVTVLLWTPCLDRPILNRKPSLLGLEAMPPLQGYHSAMLGGRDSLQFVPLRPKPLASARSNGPHRRRETTASSSAADRETVWSCPALGSDYFRSSPATNGPRR